MPEGPYSKHGVYLGYPLDQLLHRPCRVLVPKRDEDDDKGILFVRNGNGGDDPGSGNIVIMGPPGSGKSTLGLHIARACSARKENQCFSAYFSLECTPQETLKKAELFWPGVDSRSDWRIASSLPLTTTGSTTISPTDSLYRLLISGDVCPLGKGTPCERNDCAACGEPLPTRGAKIQSWPEAAEPKVLLMSLTPRPTTGRAEDHTAAFWSRYAQLESLLAAAFELRMQVKRTEDNAAIANWILPLMVIDSLNMMAEGMPSRDQLLPLFHLFRKYETTGVFLVESSTPTPFDSTLADIVIRLTVDEDQGYSARYFEVVKSRYRNQVNGRHPYKTVPAPKDKNKRRPPIPRREDEGLEGSPTPSGMIVLPSVHYAVLRGFFHDTRRKEDGAEVDDTPPEILQRRHRAWKRIHRKNDQDETGEVRYKPGGYWGVEALDDILPSGLRSGSTVLVEGPSGTYKTNLAATFLAAGLAAGDRVLLVRLHDDRMIQPDDRENVDQPQADGPALSEKIDFKWACMKRLQLKGKTSDQSGESWQELAPPLKATVTVWQNSLSMHSDFGKVLPGDARLYEIDFKTGHLLAEEFIQFIRDIVIRQPKDRPITRVVLDDVSEIGVAYPFLRNSSTSGDILLPSLVHLMKDNHVDFVVTGTTGIHPLADDAVARVRAVADTVLRSRYVDVFGRKHVVIEGEGQIASVKKEDAESRSVPAIIENIITDSEKERRFRVTQDRLRGLVGFDQGRLYRPGISLQLFQEAGKIHQTYNSDLLAMMRSAFASPEGLSDGRRQARAGSLDRSAVTLTAFEPGLSSAVHYGLDIFTKSEPMNGTVICSVDEFGTTAAKQFVGIEDFESDLLDAARSALPADQNSDRPPSLFPYYNNVLLLAYRTDIVDNGTGSLPPMCWKDLAAMLKAIPNERLGKESEMNRFEWDRTASETLTCAFLDVLYSRSKEHSSITDVLADMEHCEEELASFGSLFRMSTVKWDGSTSVSPLPNNAAVYLCWYSQLRELIDGCPDIADKLNVVALPNRGFKGDWMVGVRNGSVSAHLGKEVLTKLLSRTEDYKRFVQGVGLPCRKEISSGARYFLAWPLARKDVTLDKLLQIHTEARSRRKLEGYKEKRSALHSAARQLALRGGDPEAIEIIRDNLRQRVAQLVST